MIWLYILLGLLTLGAAMFAWDVRKAPPAPPAEERQPAPWHLEYQEHEIYRPRSVRDRLAQREEP